MNVLVSRSSDTRGVQIVVNPKRLVRRLLVAAANGSAGSIRMWASQRNLRVPGLQ